jgi:hypothetical protein
MDTNFGNLTASIDSVISVSRTASYVDSSNVYYTGTSQSFWSASISSSTIGTATVSTLNVTNLTAAGTVLLNGGLTIGAGTITGNVTGSVFGTASWATQASTASYVVTANTASYVLNAVSSSFASTASYVNNLRQTLIVSGNIVPGANNYDLGTPSNPWQDLWLSNSSLYFMSGSTTSSFSVVSGSLSGSFSGSFSGIGCDLTFACLPTSSTGLSIGQIWASGSGYGDGSTSKYLMVKWS